MASKDRIAKRRKQLLEISRSAGWENWSEFETAVLNKETALPSKSKINKDKNDRQRKSK
jgi:hypothetical protein